MYVPPCLVDYCLAFIVNFVIDVDVHARPYCNNYLSLTVVILCSFNEVVGSERIQFLFMKLHNTHVHMYFVNMLRVICM